MKTQRVTVPLDCPLPNRDWYKRPNGLWASREWTAERKAQAKQAAVKTRIVAVR